MDLGGGKVNLSLTPHNIVVGLLLGAAGALLVLAIAPHMAKTNIMGVKEFGAGVDSIVAAAAA